MQRHLLSALLLLAGIAGGPTPSLAWDKDGHEAIGMTTMSAIEGTALTQLKRLMGGKDAVDVAAWAHKVNKKYPWTKALHFQQQPTWGCGGNVSETQDCDKNRCLLKALKHFYGQLTNSEAPGLTTDVAVVYEEGMKALTDADRVKFLVNLVGDLHQPLHLGFKLDDFGRNLTISFRQRKVNLFDLWDKELTQATMADNPNFWWSGWTHIGRVKAEYEREKQEWEKKGPEVMFSQWAKDSLRFACEMAYRNPITHDKISDLSAGNKLFKVEPALYDRWKRALMERLLIAGARTAIVLNAVLKQRQAKDLHKGTGVTIEGEEEDQPADSTGEGTAGGAKSGKKRKPSDGFHWSEALMRNLAVCVPVLGIFMFGVHLAQGPVRTSNNALINEARKGEKGRL